jgi:hypothetical protein
MLKTGNIAGVVVKGIVLLSLMLFVGLCSARAEDTVMKALLELEHKDVKLYLKITNLNMYFTEAVNEVIVKDMTKEETPNRIYQVGKWSHAPLEVSSEVLSGKIRIRDETDFLVIWYHSSQALSNERSIALDVVRQATGRVLADRFALGGDQTLVSMNSPATPQSEFRIIDWPKEIPGTRALSCSYVEVPQKEKPRWLWAERVYVLVKDNDAVIAIEKAMQRHSGDRHTYEGLEAAKVRLTKSDAERATTQPVLAHNVIFNADIDVREIPDALLNGCMWPIENQDLVGVRDVGPTSYLYPFKKPVTRVVTTRSKNSAPAQDPGK